MQHCSVESVASFFTLTGRPAPAHPPVSLNSKATLQCRGRGEEEEQEEDQTQSSVRQFISQQGSLSSSTLSKGQINLPLKAITFGDSTCIYDHAP